MSIATDKSYSNCPLKKRPIQVIVDYESDIEEDSQPVDLSAPKKSDRLSVAYSIDSGYGNDLSVDYKTSQNGNYARFPAQPAENAYVVQNREHQGSPTWLRESSTSPPTIAPSSYLRYHQNYNYHHQLINHNNNVIKQDHYQSDDHSMTSPVSSHMSYSSNQSDHLGYAEPQDLSVKNEKKVLVLTDSSANIQRPKKQQYSDRSRNDLYYQCHSCSKCYSTQAGLVKHEQCHAIPQDLSGSKYGQDVPVALKSDRVCDVKTARPPIDSSNKPNNTAPRYQCPDCGKSYSTYSGLTKHQQFHCPAAEGNQVKKFFSCKNCDKVYVSLGALKMHIRTHTLPCKCPLCGKAFSRPWLLQGHIRTHTGEKPFSCQHCHRAFADRSNLRAHLQTHSDVKKYSCSSCSKTFSRMSLLGKHLQGGCSTNPVNHHNSSPTNRDYTEQSYYKPTGYSTIGQSDYAIRRDYLSADEQYKEDVHVY